VVIVPAPEIVPVIVSSSPDGNVMPPFAVKFPDTLNVPPIVVPDVELPMVVAPEAPTALPVLIFTVWVDTVVVPL
jgi:hypothetical protein